MHRSLFLFAPAVLLWLGGCEKYAGPTEVSGRVVDRHTQQPVAGAYVLAVGSYGAA